MMDTEAFREFKTGLSLLRDNYANQALEHIQRAAELERNNPYYMSYLGVALARTQQKWADAERMCDSAVRMKPRFMHDLKSLSLENAIERHKGEAAQVEDRFEELSPAEKQRLFLFLSSL